MAFGKLYTYEANPRSTAIRAVAKANDLELDIVEVDTTNPTPEYLKLNKLGKVPTFVGEDGFALYECMAIAIFSKPSPYPSRPFTIPPYHDEYLFFKEYCYPWLKHRFVEN